MYGSLGGCGAGVGGGVGPGGRQAGDLLATDGIAALQTKSCSISFVCCYISEGKCARIPLYDAARAGDARQTLDKAYTKSLMLLLLMMNIF